MIGSGVYLLPASLAPFGWNGVAGWLVTIAGATCLAATFGALSRSLPEAGGPYAFARQAFGAFPAFIVAWSYWISLWVGNVAIATGVIAPLGSVVPVIGRHHVLFTALLVWGLTAINCFDPRLVGRVQVITTVLKFLPLAAVTLLAVVVIGRGGTATLPAMDADTLRLSGTNGIGAAAAITLWAFLGLESATVPADKVADPRRTIFRATLAGTVMTGLLYLFSASSVALLLPAGQASGSGAPMADFVRPYWGTTAGTLIALCAAVSAFGALNGWILLQGELPWAMAKDGVFPRALARTFARGTPVRAHIVASSLLTIVLLINGSRTLADLFTFLILLATLASLVLYLVCSLAAVRLHTSGKIDAPGWLPLVAGASCIYSAWIIWQAGFETIGWGVVLLATGGPAYWLMRRAT